MMTHTDGRTLGGSETAAAAFTVTTAAGELHAQPAYFPCRPGDIPVAIDSRPCPFCHEPVGAKHCLVVMREGDELTTRWADQDCATFAAKKANPNRVMYPQPSKCLRCGLPLSGDHTLGDGPARCRDEEEWISPVRADHAERRAQWMASNAASNSEDVSSDVVFSAGTPARGLADSAAEPSGPHSHRPRA